MTKTITYKKVHNFIEQHIKTSIDRTTPRDNDSFTTEYALTVENQYVRFVYAGLGIMIKPAKRVSMNKCLGYLLWLKTSVKMFMRANPSYRYHEFSEKIFKAQTIENILKTFQEWLAMEFRWEVGID